MTNYDKTLPKRKPGRPLNGSAKRVQVTCTLDADVLDWLQSQRGEQTLSSYINDTLKKGMIASRWFTRT